MEFSKHFRGTFSAPASAGLIEHEFQSDCRLKNIFINFSGSDVTGQKTLSLVVGEYEYPIEEFTDNFKFIDSSIYVLSNEKIKVSWTAGTSGTCYLNYAGEAL